MAILLRTPKNLVEAVTNGLEHCPLLDETLTRRAFTFSERAELARDIEPYVRDFICDKLTCFMIEGGDSTRDALRGLYRKIIGEAQQTATLARHA